MSLLATRGNSSEACLQAVTRWSLPQIQTLEDARPSSARAAAAIPTYGKSTLVMIVVWHIKYKLLGQKRNTESSMGKNQRQLRNIMENKSAFSRSAIAAERCNEMLLGRCS